MDYRARLRIADKANTLGKLKALDLAGANARRYREHLRLAGDDYVASLVQSNRPAAEIAHTFGLEGSASVDELNIAKNAFSRGFDWAQETFFLLTEQGL